MPLNPNDPSTALTGRILRACLSVHRALGPGLLESAYQACLEYELARDRLKFKRQVSVPLTYEGVHIECGYRLDLIVEDAVIVEVKSVESLAPIHRAQMITYLKLTGYPIGLLLNFNVTSLRKGGIRRFDNRFIVNDSEPSQRTCGTTCPSEEDVVELESDPPSKAARRPAKPPFE